MTSTQSNVKTIIHPKEKDLGEFSVRRTLPSIECKQVGPWVFFDHMGPATFPAGSGINVRPHPHINLATVSYLFEGEILHRDSLGNTQAVRPGDINLMVAGRGITHSERERPEVKQSEHKLHGLQLWLALPDADEEIDPAFYHYPSDTIPSTTINDVKLRVLIGSAYDQTSPVKTFAHTLYVEAHMQAGQTLRTPNSEELALYVAEGHVTLGDITLPQYSMAILDGSCTHNVVATEASRIAFIGGESVGKRYIEWNFVSSRKERIEQAKQQWANQEFDKVVGDEKEFIPLP